MAMKQAKRMNEAGKRASFQRGEILDITAKAVAEAAKEGHEDAQELLGESGQYLGKGLALLIDILNPEVIVIGSIYARSKEFLEASMMEEIRREALELSAAACRVEPARLGERIGDYGAVMAAVYE